MTYKNTNVVIEPAAPDDAEAITELLRVTWLATYPNAAAGLTCENIRQRVEGDHGERLAEKTAKWRQRIAAQAGKPSAFVARSNGDVVGFVFPSVIDGQSRVGVLYVLPQMQGQGIGGRLLKKVLDWYGDGTDIYLRVATYNRRAIEFYQKYGFVLTDAKVKDEGSVVDGKQIPEREMVRPRLISD